MNFDFSDDQRMLRDHARRFLSEKCGPAQVRAVLENDAPYDTAVWKAMAELGWMGTALPEEFGGLGMGQIELCVIAEELGRALAPVPFSSTVYLAANAILLAGTEEQKRERLTALAAGETIATLALAEGTRAATPANLSTRFADGKISGVKTPVADGDVADLAVVVAAGDQGPVLCLVDLSSGGVSRETVATIDPTRSHATITFDSAPAERLGDGGDQWALLEAVQDRAAILFAFEQIGGAQACLEMATDYAKERFAFGRPIGSFQAIKHKLADIYIKTELARSNAYFGAWALNTGAAELPVAAAAARVAGNEAFNFAAAENIQTHGGNGFTWEYDCHIYYRRAKLLSLALGSQKRWKDRLIDRLEQRNAA